MPVEIALRNSMDALRAATDRVNGLDHAAIVEASVRPDRRRGWLEAYLIRQRAREPAALPPIEEALRRIEE
jgi:xylose isomerase